jgi:N-acetylglutamate synthase-like GNAT family acetyltransferase
MAQELEITVRRARASDADTIAAFVNRALTGQAAVDRLAVIERLGSVGFLLAERGGDLLGMLGWQAENLVVRVTDLLIWPASERVAVGRALLAEMEQAAIELQCEAVLLFSPYPSPPHVVEFWRAFGYESRIITDLPKVWQEAAREADIGDDGAVLIKQLRARRVVRPL